MWHKPTQDLQDRKPKVGILAASGRITIHRHCGSACVQSRDVGYLQLHMSALHPRRSMSILCDAWDILLWCCLELPVP